MKMTGILALIIGLGFAVPVLALDNQGMNERVNELELENDMEEFDSFGEAARAEQAKRERVALAAEMRRLENDIKKSEVQTQKESKAADNLVVNLNKKQSLAKSIGEKAKRAERAKIAAQKRKDQLQAKVDREEKKAIKTLEQRKYAENATRDLERAILALQKRERVAQQAIGRNEANRKKAMVSWTKSNKKKSSLSSRVNSLERRAAR